MKYLLIILFLWTGAANATTYYVNIEGSNSNGGTTQAAPFQTAAKALSVVAPNDSILFRKGDVWNEKIVIPVSNLYIGSYGTGAKPIISGFAYVTGFINVGNIWSATFAASKTLNNVTINGVQTAKGRYPNNSYLLTTNAGTDTTVNTSLTGTPSYVGAEIVVKEVRFIIDVSKVKSQTGGALTLSKPLTYSGYSTGYFFQNHSSLLDTLNEWSFDSSTNTFSMYATSAPTLVQASNIDTLIYINGKNYITFEGINFSGANMSAFELNNSKNIIVNNCKVNNIGRDAFTGTLLKNITITKDSILNVQSCGVRFDPDTLTNISYNYFKNIGYRTGMGQNGNGTYNGIYQLGPNFRIYGNRLDSIGFNGVNYKGNNGLVKYNYTTNYAFIKDDGGAYYTYIGTSSPMTIDTGTIVRRNIAINGIGSPEGTGITNRYADGFYFDTYANGILCDSNTSAFNTDDEFLMHQNTDITLRGNTAYSINANGFLVDPYTASFVRLYNNITYNANSTYRSLVYDAPQGLAVVDSNYFMRPTLEAGKIRYGGTPYGQSDFVAATGLNSHGGETPASITSTTPLFIMNPAFIDSIASITGSYINARGETFTDTITLKPFASEILFPINAIAAPVIRFRSKFKNLKL